MNTIRTKIINPMLMTDFYKTIHHLAYTPSLDFLTSYWTPRMSRISGINKVVMFGLQGFIIEYLIDKFNTNFFTLPWSSIESEYIRVISHTMSVQASDPSALLSLHSLGYLPIRIRAVSEGERVNIKTPMFEITNTVSGFGWLVNYLETFISVNIWHPMTSATIAYSYRDLVNEYFDLTVDSGVKSSACGDFSMRGMTSPDSAMKCSAGHLLSFTGTATIPSILWLEDYYNCDCSSEVVGRGVPSTEHSVMSSYGRDGEFECYRHLIEDVFKTGPLSIVSDTYNYWQVLTDYIPRLKGSILSRDGKIIIRGDSGDPVDIICGELKADSYMYIDGLTESDLVSYFSTYVKSNIDDSGFLSESTYSVRISDYLYSVTVFYTFVSDLTLSCGGYYSSDVCEVSFTRVLITPAMKGTIELLWEIFGGSINSKGYKVLDSHIGAIYGDGITPERARSIYERLSSKGFAVSNCTLGIGSYTYQYCTRDTFGFALKATDSVICGVETSIFKDPLTDLGTSGGNFKKSQRGLCYVYRAGEDILYTDGHTFDDLNSDKYSDNLLEVVFKDGKLVKEYSLSEIRCRLHNGTF